MSNRGFVLLLLVLVCAASRVQGQQLTTCDRSTVGKEFILGLADIVAQDNRHTQNKPELRLRVVVEGYSTRVHIYAPVQHGSSITLKELIPSYYARSMDTILIASSWNLTQSSKGFSDTGAVVVRSDNPISLQLVYRFTHSSLSTEDIVHIVYPVDILSKDYVLPSAEPNDGASETGSQLMIVALNDSTSVSIRGYEISINVGLEQYGTYFDKNSQKDLSGAIIIANNPIAVFSTFSSGYHRYSSSAYLKKSKSLQVAPTDATARHFIVPRPYFGSGSSRIAHTVRVYATKVQTMLTIYERSTPQYVHLYEKIFYEITTTNKVIELFADNPITVVVTASGNMCNIPAVSQYATEYLLYNNDHDGLSAKVIIPSDESTGLLLDGKPLLHTSELHYGPSGTSNHTVIDLNIERNHKKLTHVGNIPFGLVLLDPLYTPGMRVHSTDCGGSGGPIIG